MGKYVNDKVPYYIEGKEEEIRKVLSEYNENIHRFYTKQSVRAGRRARNNLLELYHLIRPRRKEILEEMHEYIDYRRDLRELEEQEDAS
jgi:hypothetical protein